MQFGSKKISKLQYGSKNVIAVYFGSKKVWEADTAIPDTPAIEESEE